MDCTQILTICLQVVAIIAVWGVYKLSSKDLQLIYKNATDNLNTIYEKTTKAMEKEREIKGKEKLLHACVTFLVAQPPSEIQHYKGIYDIGPESIWFLLDNIYTDPPSVRNSFNSVLQRLPDINSVRKLHAMDAEIRAYYKMAPPKEINE